MGFMNLFKNIRRSADAKAQEMAEQIEADNVVEFGKQDIAKMKTDLQVIRRNIGSIKGEIAVLEDKEKGIMAQIKKHDEDALALSEAKQEDLANQHAEAAVALESQLESFREALKKQRSLLDEQLKNKMEFEKVIQQAEANLVTIKALDDVTRANENLAQISTSSGTNALAAFKEREEMARKRFHQSQAMKEENSTDNSLAAETAKVLGKSAAKDRLARLQKEKGQA
jgi:phage shock protein A